MARISSLTDIQYILLATACRRAEGHLLPWPRSLAEHGDAIPKAVASLLRRQLIEEVEVGDPAQARRATRKKQFGLAVTAEGRARVAAEEQEGREVIADDMEAAAASAPTHKPALVVALLQRKDGATIAEVIAATGWLPHSARAAISGLRKRGHSVTTEKVDGVTRYRIAAVR
jgi:hypothetical protein